jgi:protease I
LSEMDDAVTEEREATEERTAAEEPESPGAKPRKRRRKRASEAAVPSEAGSDAAPGTPLRGKRAAILIAGKFQDEEGVGPAAYLRDLGMDTVFVGIEPGSVTGKYEREEVEVDLAVADAEASEFDLLIIPGGGAPETLRLNPAVLAFTRRFFDDGKPVAAICRGPQVLISAGVLPGRTVTCLEGIRDDVRLAGARYRDKPVVVDRNLVTARVPDDLPAFNQAILALLTASASPSEAPEEVAVEE